MSDKRPLLDVVQEAIETQTAFGELLSAEEKQYLLDHGVVRSAAPGEVLCQQQQLDTRVYILVIGEVEVSEGEGANRVVLANLRRGELFGEISALFKIPRISTVTVVRPAVLLELPGDVLERVVSSRTELCNAVIRRYKQRITDTALRSVPMFRYLPRENLQALIDSASLVSHPASAEIVKEDEPGDALYIMIFGTARVSRVVSCERLNVALLRPGEYFGEWSVLTGAPRTATVSALTRVEVLRVDCEPFLQFIQDNPQIRDRIDMVAYNRHAQAADPDYAPESQNALDKMVSRLEDIINNE